jgi:hypothetical protein
MGTYLTKFNGAFHRLKDERLLGITEPFPLLHKYVDIALLRRAFLEMELRWSSYL